MNTMNGVTWTTPEEAFDLYAYFFKKLGDGITEPRCMRCGDYTGYIVEAGTQDEISYSPAMAKPNPWAVPAFIPGEKVVVTKFSRKHVNFLSHFLPKSKFYKDGMIYIPVTGCYSCGARDDARMRHSMGFLTPPDTSSWAMTEAEKAKYNRIFNLKMKDLCEKTAAQSDQSRLKASRYKV